jgi:hypothetical protein
VSLGPTWPRVKEGVQERASARESSMGGWGYLPGTVLISYFKVNNEDEGCLECAWRTRPSRKLMPVVLRVYGKIEDQHRPNVNALSFHQATRN